MKFVFVLTKAEAKFLNKILTQEISYNGDEVFNYAELHKTFWESVRVKLEEDKISEEFTFKINIKTLLILHHLIKGYSVKGRTNDFQLFMNVLFKIANVNKLFNAYNIIIERIKTDREIWGNGLDEITKRKDPEYIKHAELLARESNGKILNPELLPVTDEDLGKTSND
jgi:hypothetical protein